MMNNRYIFRGKRLDNGEWVEGYYVFNFWNMNEATIHLLEGGCCTVDPATVGQCTGTKDKNGVLAFEGDVVRVMWNESRNESEIYTIEDIRQIPSIRNSNKDFEIAGNIYDNPELLKGEAGNE